MAKKYSFGGQSISEEQANNIKQLAMMDKLGLVDPKSAKSSLASVLFTKPSATQQALQQLLGGGGDNQNIGTDNLDYGFNPITPMKQTSTPVEEGTFGFGTSKGQLFGEGGLVGQVTQPFRQGLINPAFQLGQTAVRTGMDVLQGKPLMADQALEQKQQIANQLLQEAQQIQDPIERQTRIKAISSEAIKEGINVGQETALGNPLNAQQNQQSILVSGQENKDYNSNPLLGGFKSSAGIGSFAIPGGSTLGGAVARGIGSGALFGFGTSRPGEELNNTLQGGVGGGIGGGVGFGLGKVASKILNKVPEENILTKVGGKVDDLANRQEVGAFQRAVGKKIPKSLGGQDTARSMKELGLFAVKDADELAEKALSVIDDQGGQIRPALQGINRPVTADEILKPLQSKLDNPTILKSDKAALQTVYDDIKGVFDSNEGILSPEQVYNLKQGLGVKSKFDSTVSNTARDAYRDTYIASNDLIDGILKESGFENFRTINKNVSTALNALEYAKQANSQVMAGRPFNLLDTVTAAGGLSTGGLPGMMLAGGVSKAIQSPQAENLLVKALRGTAKGLDKVGSVSPSVPNLNIGRIPALGGSMIANSMNPQTVSAAGLPQNGPVSTLGGTQTSGGIDTNQLNNILLIGLLNGEIDASTVTAVQSLLGNGGGKTLSEGQTKFANAAQAADNALNLLESGKVNTGIGQNLVGGIQNFFDTKSAEQTDYESTLASARGLAINALSGANVPPAEYERIADLIPEVGDQPERAKQKLISFKKAMEVYATPQYR